MMPASTTLASSQPRWGDQKAPITAAPETSQNPFRHLVGRGAPCVSASSKAPAGHAAVLRLRTSPGRLHWSSQLPVCRRAALQGSGSAKGWRRRTRIWREATTRANPGEERGGQRYFEAPVRPGSRPHRVSEGGGDEQMFGAKQQVPHGGFRRLTSDGSAAHSSGAANWRSPRCGVSALPVFLRPLAARVRAEAEHELAPSRPVFLPLPACSVKISTAFLASHLRMHPEKLSQQRKPPVVLKKVRPLDGLQRDRPARPTEGRASERPSDFSRLCESVTPLPPKEQASRVRQHFGILGGARPAEGPGRRAKNAGH